MRLLKELLEPQETMWLISWRFTQRKTLSCTKPCNKNSAIQYAGDVIKMGKKKIFYENLWNV